MIRYKCPKCLRSSMIHIQDNKATCMHCGHIRGFIIPETTLSPEKNCNFPQANNTHCVGVIFTINFSDGNYIDACCSHLPNLVAACCEYMSNNSNVIVEYE
jgi:hypothetical protein